MKYYPITLLALTTAGPVFAQTQTQTQAQTAEAIGPRDEIIVTASRSGEGVPQSNLGASVTVLDQEALSERQTRIISDILRDVPGVAVNRSGAIGGLTQVRIRGTESNHTLVLVDGMEVADPYNGEYDFGTLIADPAARIEVLRGQQSSLYGSDAIGGVINYITLSGREAPGYMARLEGGSMGTISGAVRAAQASDTFDYAVSASYYRTNGYPTARNGTRKIGSESIGATAKVNWLPSDNFSLSGVLRYSNTDADMNDTDYDTTSPLFGYIIDTPGKHFTNEALYGLLSAKFTGLDGRWVTTLSGQFSDTKRKGYSSFGFDSGNKGVRHKGSLTSSLTLGTDIQHRLTGAVDVERESFQNTTPSPYVFGGKRHTNNVGIVGQYEMFGDTFSFGASVRHDDNNRFDDATSWRVQGSYKLSTDTRIHAAYGTGVKNPTYYELFGYSDGKYIGNPNLKPEKSKGWEVGVEQNIGVNHWAKIGVTYFDSKLTHEIYTSYPPPSYVATPANRDTLSKQHGIEAFISARPIPLLHFDLNYTWLNAKENGVTELRRPRHMGSFNATVLSNDERFSGTLTLRYNGSMIDAAYIDPSYIPVHVKMKEFTLINLGAQYKISDNFSIFGRIDNLINEKYEEIFSYVASDRSVYGGVNMKL